MRFTSGQRTNASGRWVAAVGLCSVLTSTLAGPGCARFGFETLDPVLRGIGSPPDNSRAGSGGAGSALNWANVDAAVDSAGGSAAGAGTFTPADASGLESSSDAGVAGAGATPAAEAGSAGGSAGVDAGPVVPLGCASDVPLRRRPEGQPPTAVAGRFDMLNPGWWRIARTSEWITLQGQGYVPMRWTIEYATRAGLLVMPTVTVSGTFFRVGGGGGYRLDDPRPSTTGTYMGNSTQGVAYMPPGVETPWHDEYYYLDGEVTITLDESGAMHDIEVQAQTYEQVTTPGAGVYSPGVVCDR